MAEDVDVKAQAIREAYRQAEEMKSEGVPAELIKETISKKLIAKGLDEKATAILTSNLPGVRHDPEDNPEKGKRSMVVGAGLFFFGLIITMVLEIMAINKSVGYYTIAIGPMLLGLGIFIKGFIEYRLR